MMKLVSSTKDHLIQVLAEKVPTGILFITYASSSVGVSVHTQLSEMSIVTRDQYWESLS